MTDLNTGRSTSRPKSPTLPESSCPDIRGPWHPRCAPGQVDVPSYSITQRPSFVRGPQVRTSCQRVRVRILGVFCRCLAELLNTVKVAVWRRLSDLVGADIGLHVGSNFLQEWPGRTYKAYIFKLMNDHKLLGEKTGAGFYTFDQDKCAYSCTSSQAPLPPSCVLNPLGLPRHVCRTSWAIFLRLRSRWKSRKVSTPKLRIALLLRFRQCLLCLQRGGRGRLGYRRRAILYP